MNDINKKITDFIERIGYDNSSIKNKYIYKFSNEFEIEKIEDDDIKQIILDNLVDEFRIALNQAIFGDSAGKNYINFMINYMQNEKINQNWNS